jgi:hypothetical protein
MGLRILISQHSQDVPKPRDDGMNNVLSYLLTYLGYLNNVFLKGKTFSDFREGVASVASSRDAKS